MMAQNRRGRHRRLADMSALAEQSSWSPAMPPDGLPFEVDIPVSETVSFRQVLSFDEVDRLVDWAVVQRRNGDGRWRRVAVYDMSHGKGVHLHLYDRDGREIEQIPGLRTIGSYKDIETGLDYAVERVTKHWGDNELRSDRGR